MILYAFYFFMTAIIAYEATLGMRAYSLRASILDQPNERSLHAQAVPRGGGIGIVIAIVAPVLTWFIKGGLSKPLAQIIYLSIGMAVLGFWDDRVSLSARFRFGIQALLAVAVIFVFEQGFSIESRILAFGFAPPAFVLWVFILLFSMWMTNLFNFMDGSDGMAGTQALTVAMGLFVLSLVRGYPEAANISAIVAGASLGFLFVNWQPAKIFMGDVGSLFLGFLFAALILWTAFSGVVPFASALTLQGCFVVDATVTLLRRLKRGEKPHVAHRSHAYQRMVLSGLSHSRVALMYGAVNLLWLLPIAALSASYATWGAWMPWASLFAAWLPLFAFALWKRAGDNFTSPPL